MIKISDSLKEIIQKNPMIQFGFYHRLFNLSKLAAYLKPLMEARTKKEIKTSALLMNLSRLQRIMSKAAPNITNLNVNNVSIFSNLCSMSFLKSPKVHTEINSVYSQIQKNNGYVTVTEGTNEVTIIFDQKFEYLIEENELFVSKSKFSNISGIGVNFDEKYLKIPGMLYLILQQITLQGVNVVEISSTYTEFILYVDKKDTQIVFNTIFTCFSM